VLFFEDQSADVELLLWTLQSAEFDVASDVVATLDAVLGRVTATEYDVILADYRMPGSTGMDVFRALKAKGVSVPFILVTGSLGDEKAVECLKDGVADYVLKDRPARLPVAVRRALEERRLREDRAHAEQALRRSEASYRSLIESAPCGILRMSAETGRFLEVNAALAEMLGYDSASELLASELVNRLALDIETRRRLGKQYEQQGRPETDVEWTGKDGAPITVRLSGRVLRDKDGAAICFEMIAENVTSRQRAEERIRQLHRLHLVSTLVSQAIVRIRGRDELFRQICQIAVEEGEFRMAWVGAVDPDTLLVRPVASAGIEEGYLAGIRISVADEPSGHGPAGNALRHGRHFVCDDTRTDPGFAPWRAQALQRSYRSVGSFPLSVRGRPIAAMNLYASEPGLFDDENLALLDKLAADVSFALESMETVELRQRAVDELNQFFTLSLDMLGIVGMDGGIRVLNPAWEKTIGFNGLELRARPMLDLVHSDDRPRMLAAVQQLRAGEEQTDVEIRICSKNGPYKWLMFNATPVPRQGLIFVAAHDVTDRKRLEEQLREQNLALEETNQRVETANRMKSEFLANMSHELRSPLNCIVGFSELLFDARLGPISDRQKEILGRVLNSARHLLQLINDILDLSKVEAGRLEFHPESLSSSKLIQEVTGILGGLAAAKGIRIETEVEPDVATMVADPGRFKQVLYNYVSNALKFTSEGGRVRVNLRAEGASELRLEVSDTGVGIAPKDLGKLFIEFQQLDSGKGKRFQGTGLGLALTKRIVEAQGGRVGVESTPGEGSTFFAVLPRAGGNCVAAMSPQVLIIEDERIERTVMTHILQKEGFAVDTAGTCAEAVAKCHDQSFDAITLDLLLPDGDGKQLLEEIRASEQNRTTPVIVVSMVEEVDAAALPGVQEVLKKPVSRQDLVAALERAGLPATVKVVNGK
jgi:PAS domain S-box-containing protein